MPKTFGVMVTKSKFCLSSSMSQDFTDAYREKKKFRKMCFSRQKLAFFDFPFSLESL